MAEIGSVRDIQVAFKPLVGIGPGSIVRLAPGDYAELLYDKWECRHGAMAHYVVVRTVVYPDSGFEGPATDIYTLETAE